MRPAVSQEKSVPGSSGSLPFVPHRLFLLYCSGSEISGYKLVTRVTMVTRVVSVYDGCKGLLGLQGVTRVTRV